MSCGYIEDGVHSMVINLQGGAQSVWVSKKGNKMANFELKPGDTATIKQEDELEITVRAYPGFIMVQSAAWGTKMEVDTGDSDWTMSVKSVKKEDETCL